MNILQEIRHAYSDLTPSFSKVGKYILNNHRDAAFMTAAAIAKQSQVSESVVVRFAKSLGYSGYPEMLRAIQELVKREMSPTDKLHLIEEAAVAEVHPDMNGYDVLKIVATQDIKNLQKTVSAEKINNSVESSIQAIINSEQVWCMGLLGLSNLAGLLAFMLDIIGIRAHKITQGDAAIFHDLRNIGSNDVLIAFAFHRYTRRTTEILEIARDAGVATIVITDSYTSPASHVAENVLVVSVELESVLNSYVGAVSIVNALVLSCLVRDIDRCRDNLEQIEQMLPRDEFHEGDT